MIRVKDLAISFSGHQLFEEVNININRREKIGLIGRNGSGKSSFLKLILNKIEPDFGEVVIPTGYRIGHLEQYIKFTHDTILDEICSILPEERQYEAWKGEIILAGLGFSEADIQKSPHDFSGGFQVKINLAKLLLMEPDMLLLDEPTNYLDIYSIRWLKEFLKDWEGELILITHDRGFMDEVITHSLTIHRGKFRKLQGNTSNVFTRIEQEEEIYNKARESEAKKRQQTEEWINRFKSKASQASRVQSRVKQLEKMEVQEKLAKIDNLEFSFNYDPYKSKEDIIQVNKVSFAYDAEDLIKNLSFKVAKGDKICVIGKNGKGKSTLLKILNNNLASKGVVKLNDKTTVGYFGQMNIDILNPELSVCEEIQLSDPELDITNVRKICANMMFTGNLAHKKIAVLSGGEKSRVMLGKIIAKPVNLLFLDEPTNHLDIESSEALMNAIKNFEGAVVMVTHDEYFLNEVANKLVIFDDNKTFLYDGIYQDFLGNIGWQDAA